MLRPRPGHPYGHAPRLPTGAVALDDLIPGGGPFEIEIGPGRGGFAIERVRARPDIRLLGLEIRLKWATLVDERLAREGFGVRARVFAEDAREALARIEPAASVDAAYLHFPDPWWKKRHEKRLVMGDALLDDIARLLRDGAPLFIQTDVEDRAGLYRAQVEAHAAFEPAGDAPGSPVVEENPFEARSHRERRAIRDGLPIHRMLYRRLARPS